MDEYQHCEDGYQSIDAERNSFDCFLMILLWEREAGRNQPSQFSVRWVVDQISPWSLIGWDVSVHSSLVSGRPGSIREAFRLGAPTESEPCSWTEKAQCLLRGQGQGGHTLRARRQRGEDREQSELFVQQIIDSFKRNGTDDFTDPWYMHP